MERPDPVVLRSGRVFPPDVERLEQVGRRLLAPAVGEPLLAEFAVPPVGRLVGDDPAALVREGQIEEAGEAVERGIAE